MAGVDVTKAACAAYDAFRAGDLAGIIDLCAPNTEWTLYGRVPWAGTHKGREAVKRDFLETLNKYTRTTGFDTPVVMAGDKPDWVYTPRITWTATLLDPKGEAREDSPKVTVQMCTVMEVQNGKITRYWNYCDTHEVMQGLVKAGTVKE